MFFCLFSLLISTFILQHVSENHLNDNVYKHFLIHTTIENILFYFLNFIYSFIYLQLSKTGGKDDD